MEYQILIVDDDKDLSWIIAEMLQDYGYKVLCAADSAAAFEMLEHIKVHLILLDINLPDTDGFVFCRELRRVSGIPIIFASARTSENDKIEGFELGGGRLSFKAVFHEGAVVPCQCPDSQNLRSGQAGRTDDIRKCAGEFYVTYCYQRR